MQNKNQFWQNSDKNMHNKDLGYRAEAIAKIYYEKIGWASRDQNVTYRGSELDLVMEREYISGGKSGVEFLFVEVKAMEIGGRDGLTPEDNFSRAKQKHFKRGIEVYLVKSNVKPLSIRIDLACLYYNPMKNSWSIKIYPNIILE